MRTMLSAHGLWYLNGIQNMHFVRLIGSSGHKYNSKDRLRQIN